MIFTMSQIRPINKNETVKLRALKKTINLEY
jgi:hypothetical protein